MKPMTERIIEVVRAFNPVESNESKLREDVMIAAGCKHGASRSHPDGVTHSYTVTVSWAEVERQIAEDDAKAALRKRERMFVP